ncbi:hypothetical protein PVN32_22240 [Bacillus paralicheniformis]|uniref:Uncharacterized protein n=1 Tax=Bacillus paralicheniformis TaxID=1648923 RepID=A0AAW6KG82_9BACI|nr:hypothetical protein [Bacillus paralicheniformis]MDE1454870.1 hypothetical protein [Bacillus paralicheniformis]
MTKTNEKIHVLADESLGGIKREYVEVDRKAEVGDKIIVTEGDDFPVGHIDTVAHWYDNYDDGSIDLFEGFDNDIFLDGNREEYRVLEPTNIVHIDGPDGTERYEMVDRKAEVGEKVVVVDDEDSSEEFGNFRIGEVGTVESYATDDTYFGEYANVRVSDGRDIPIYLHEYRVLVPLESSEEEPQPSDPIDVIANLATRVAELERENKRIQKELGWYEVGAGSIANLRNDVADIRHDIAKLEDRIVHDYATNEDVTDFLYEEVKRLQDEIDTLHKDNRRNGEELAKIKDRIDDFQDAENDRIYNLYAITNGKRDEKMFTAEEVATLLNAMRERQ